MMMGWRSAVFVAVFLFKQTHAALCTPASFSGMACAIDNLDDSDFNTPRSMINFEGDNLMVATNYGTYKVGIGAGTAGPASFLSGGDYGKGTNLGDESYSVTYSATLDNIFVGVKGAKNEGDIARVPTDGGSSIDDTWAQMEDDVHVVAMDEPNGLFACAKGPIFEKFAVPGGESQGRAFYTNNFGQCPKGMRHTSDDNYVYFGTTLGRMVRLARGTPTLEIETFELGCCSHQVYLMDGAKENIYVGTDSGIAFRINLQTMTASEYIFVGPNIMDGVIDTSVTPNVIFFVTFEGVYARCNTEPFVFYDSVLAEVTAEPVKFFSLSMISQSNRFVAAYEDHADVLRGHSCASYGKDCSACLADVYCSYCALADTSCIETADGVCDAGESVSDADNCPSWTAMAPVRAPNVIGEANGAAILTLTGTGFVEMEGSYAYACAFNGGPGMVATTRISSTEIQCAVTNVGASPMAVGLLYTKNNGITYPFDYLPDTFELAIYDCGAASSCATCLDTGPLCVWCPNEGGSAVCGAKCAGEKLSVCPRLNAVVPTRSVNSATVTIYGSNMVPTSGGDDYVCHFGGTPVTGVRTSSTEVTCVAPDDTGVVSLSLEYPAGENYFGTEVIDFTFYTCATAGTSCGSCLDGSGTCNFCFSSSGGTCGSALPTPPSCASPDYLFTSSCPTIIGVEPLKAPVDEVVTFSVSVGGAGLLAGNLLRCSFPDLVPPATTAATTLTSTSLTCRAPASPSAGVTALEIEFEETAGVWVPLIEAGARPFSVEFYDCSTFTDCSLCLPGGVASGCGWCPSAGRCLAADNCPAPDFYDVASSCPSLLTVNTLEGSLTGASTGGTSLTITGSNFVVPAVGVTGYECVWNKGDTTEDLPATRLSSNSIVCQSPIQGSAVVSRFSVHLGDALYAPDLADNGFAYFDCSLFDDCASCLSISSPSGCAWCSSTATCGSTCPGGLKTKGNSCPSIAYSVGSQTGSDSSGGSAVVIQGDAFHGSTTYQCYFGGEASVATNVLATSITCAVPAGTAGASIELSVVVQSLSRDYATNRLAFTYYGCEEAASCQECVASVSARGDCGWCRQSGTCSSASTCASGFGTTCPVVTSLPGRQSGSTAGGSLIQVEGDYFGNYAGRTYKCLLDDGALEAPATIVSDTMVECLTPVRSEEGLSTVKIGIDNTTYADGTALFIYYDCSATPTCEACNAAPFYDECGWCLSSVSCSVQSLCEGGFSNSSCPTASSVLPPSGHVQGGTVVSIVGTTMGLAGATESTPGAGAAARLPRLACKFGDTIVNASSSDQRSIVCSAPRAPSGPGTVSLEILAAGKRFISAAEEFSYYTCPSTSVCAECTGAECGFCNGACSRDCPAGGGCPDAVIEDGGSTTVAVAGSVSAVLICLLCVAVVVLLVVVTKKKQDVDYSPLPLSKKQLFELKYQIADNDNRSSMSLNATVMAGEKGVNDFKTMLIEDPSFDLVHALVAVCPSTEAEKVAHALTVLFENEGRAMDVICSLVSAEVKMSKAQSTLFRTNSYATKMYKSYSRIRGTEYVRDTIGFVINESLANAKNTEVDDRKMGAGDDQSLNKWTLMATCQKIIMSILQSEDKIGPGFRRLFMHVSKEINEKYAFTTDELGTSVQAEVTGQVRNIREMQAEAQATFASMGDSVDPAFVAAARETVKLYDESVDSMKAELQLLLESFDDIQAAADPNSKAAADVLKKHQDTLNSIAVGGFYFLRWILSAITAPDTWGIIRNPPVSDEGRRMLTLVSKVIMNLSNGREFGKKEAYMLKMNEFIVSNLPKVQEFFRKMLTPVDMPTDPPEEIPDSLIKEQVEHLYVVFQENQQKITQVLNDRAKAADAESARF